MDGTNETTRNGRKAYWLSGGFVALLGLIAVALTAVPSSVAAFGRGGSGMHEFMQWRVEKLLDQVEATDEQKQQIEAIIDSRKQALRELHPDREALHASVAALLTADEIDRAAMEALRAEQIEVVASVSRLMVDSLADVAEVLEPAQRLELARLLEEHREHRHHRRHHREGGWRD